MTILCSSAGKESTCNQEILVQFLGQEDFLGEGIGYPLQYSWASLWLSWWRICLQCGRPGFDPWIGKIPWKRERLPTPVFWHREFHRVAKSQTWLSAFHFPALWVRIPQKRWSRPHSQQESLKCSTWMQSQKQRNDLGSFPRQTIQDHSNPSLCPNQWCWRSWTVLLRPTRPSRTNTSKWQPTPVFLFSGGVK